MLRNIKNITTGEVDIAENGALRGSLMRRQEGDSQLRNNNGEWGFVVVVRGFD